MLYKPEHKMTFGVNKDLSLKDIYQYKPWYLQYLIEFHGDFEIDIDDFKNLPNPTIADPDQLPPEEGQRIRFYPPIKLELSVRIIRDYINNGGKFKELTYTFSNKMVEILELKRKGVYVVPNYVDRHKV